MLLALTAAAALGWAQAAAFPAVSARATAARLAGKHAEAIAAYRQALKLNPQWYEGWFFLGSIHYEQDQGPECAAAFERFTALQPKVSAGFAFLGLCRYQTGAQQASLAAFERARRIGMPEGEQLTDVASYHAALLYIRAENFERALQILHYFSRRAQIDPKIVEAAGLAVLRQAIFPRDMAVDDRELVYRAGRAVMVAGDRRAAEAGQQFAELVRDYPSTPNLHYAYAAFLLGSDAELGLAELNQELAARPNHLPSLVLAGLEYLKRGDAAAAKPFGERAVQAAPGNFTAHVLLGRALVSLEETEAGIRELELAVKLEPTSPQTRIALASAYQKAGKPAEAARERAEFQRLKKLLDEGSGAP
jgi:predicted Zn-dependent protease